MAGFIYRRAMALKDLGERVGSDWLIRLGYLLREVAYRGKIKQSGEDCGDSPASSHESYNRINQQRIGKTC
jgi:hypothetical protein